jgi:hypothetical protein
MIRKTRTQASLRVKPCDVELLRKNPSNLEAYTRICRACESWLRRFGTGLSRDDRMDIVAEAICDNIDALKPNSKIPITEAPILLQRSLNRLRSQAQRTAAKKSEYKISDEVRIALDRYLKTDIDEELDDKRLREQREKRLLNALFTTGKYIKLAVEVLSPRDYAILHHIYKFDQFGLKEPAEQPAEQLSESARKVSVFRARHRFLEELEKLLDAAHKALSVDRQDVEDALKVVRSKEFEEWLRQ